MMMSKPKVAGQEGELHIKCSEVKCMNHTMRILVVHLDMVLPYVYIVATTFKSELLWNELIDFISSHYESCSTSFPFDSSYFWDALILICELQWRDAVEEGLL